MNCGPHHSTAAPDQTGDFSGSPEKSANSDRRPDRAVILGVLRRAGLARAQYRAPQRVHFPASGALDGLADRADGTARADPAGWIPYEVET